jgi:hypothetical protein
MCLQATLCGLLVAACAPLPPAVTPGAGGHPAESASVTPVAAPPAAPAASAPTAPAAVPVAPAALATPTDLATREMLAYHDRIRQLSPADVAREITRLGSEANAGPRSSFELALLLAQSRGSGDLARALGLLDALVRSSAPEAAPWQPLARLVAVRFAEQRRLEEQIDRQMQQARDNQRRVEQLNDKLEALKAIERNLTTRPGTNASPSAPGGKGAPP